MKKILDYIEDKDITINNNWFYHAMPFSHDSYANALNNGILAPHLLKNYNSSYKYVFVSRVNNNSKCSAFNNYSIYPSFIINDNIQAIKAEDSSIKKLIYKGFHGLHFTSMYNDEYQVYKKINPKEIIGILFNLEKLIKTNKDNTNYYFNLLSDIIFLLNELELTIPIIDYYKKKEINKQKVLSLTKDNIYKLNLK